MRTPKEDGFFMPAEFEKQHGCILIWPERQGSWPHGAEPARKIFVQIIEAISRSERVYVAASKAAFENAVKALKGLKGVIVFPAETEDAWARDTAPTFVIDGKGNRRCVNWEFNAWGGTYNGLYANWEKDNAFAGHVATYLHTEIYDARPFVLEGGSVHSDGEGTLMVTEACLLSKGRNPKLTQEEISDRLCEFLGAEKVLWLPRGIYGDETDEHVDNVCAFVKPGEVVLAWTDRKEDPQYALSQKTLQMLEQAVDARGRRLKIHKLPIPDHPVLVQKEDLEGYVFEEGEDVREVGERLAASYINFYFSNDSVILPAFGGENTASDQRAMEIMEGICPDRKIVQIPGRDILLGGGGFHCITQQVPEVRGVLE